MQWDLFCRVVDNFGDVGVCWRLARELAARGETVRLVIDDASALTWMAPGGAPGVQVLAWPAAEDKSLDAADVVVETFGCALPPAYVESMLERARRASAPVWINLEYLSAEPYVERSHGLPSPQANGLPKWFFYPGFTSRTGGLLCEADLDAQQARFDRHAWLAAQGLALRPGERLISLFCYANAALPQVVARLAEQPGLLLLTPGAAQEQVKGASGGRLRLARLPWLSQSDYDRLLWACDLNFVRGEDSMVRALWAGAPCVWQAYPQHDAAHHPKVQALVETLALPADAAALWRAWNAMPVPADWAAALPPSSAWQAAARAARERLSGGKELASELMHFACGESPTPC